MTKLTLDRQRWNLSNNTTLDTVEIYSQLYEKKLDQDLLCWNDEHPKKQPVSFRFRLLSKYGLLETIGKGGFGSVFLAFDGSRFSKHNKVGSLVAIKYPVDEQLQKPEIKSQLGQMFAKEAFLTANLAMCENVVSVTDYDIDIPFIVLEYCNQGNLLVRMEKSYDAEDIYNWGYQIAKGLEAAHNIRPNLLVHRDLKPANVLIHNNII